MQNPWCTCWCWSVHKLICGQRASSGASLQELQHISVVAGIGSPFRLELFSENLVCAQHLWELTYLYHLSPNAEIADVCQWPWPCT